MNIISGVRNTVAKMADAMDTTDACMFAIRSKTWPEISHWYYKHFWNEDDVHYQKRSMWCWKICRKCWYRGKCRQKMRARGETYPQWKACFTVRFSNTALRWDISYCCTLLKHKKVSLGTLQIKADFALNVLLVHISVLWECFMCKMLDHIALLRAIKKKKKKNLFPTDRPCLEKGIYGQANYFFFLALPSDLLRHLKWYQNWSLKFWYVACCLAFLFEYIKRAQNDVHWVSGV